VVSNPTNSKTSIYTLMRKTELLLASLLTVITLVPQRGSSQTYCNPLNISYRFCLDVPSRREAADPTIVLYKDNYYLFASKSGGYWYSSDLLNWNFVTSTDLPLENYAPTAVVIKDSLYFLVSDSKTIYRTGDPISGHWEIYNSSFLISSTDPALFADTDGKVYLYFGCSNNSPLKAVELDVNQKLMPKGEPKDCFGGIPTEHGWEKPGDYNQKSDNPWIEGSWMTKYNGKYYYQYAAPGTEFKSYSDGVYVSDGPMGPFTLATNNPFSSKPEGFICGAGHGSTFQDKYGNWWHIATMTISVKHMFERRLGLFPVSFDSDGNLYTNSYFGDYPISIPNQKCNNIETLGCGWMLLSYNKTAGATSSSDAYPIENAFDENVRTYWSAQTGNAGEWLSVDLGKKCDIRALQVDFAENNTELFGRENILAHQYLIEYSNDNSTWETLIDKTNNEIDLTHEYFELKRPVEARYFRITNKRVPGGTFAISDFRVFGFSDIPKPSGVGSYNVLRSQSDPRIVELKWKKQENATGYNIRYGNAKDKLYHTYQVYSDTSVIIRSLDKDQTYWFAVDAFGESGVTLGQPIKVPAIKLLEKSTKVSED
jgi:xylan 1,4-beta-xylosidase